MPESTAAAPPVASSPDVTAERPLRANPLLVAAIRIEEAARDLATGMVALRTALDAHHRVAWDQAQADGARDVATLAHPSRVAEEIAGVLVAAGCGALFTAPIARGVTPVKDLVGLWADRLTQGQLVTHRTPPDAASGHVVLPGQRAVTPASRQARPIASIPPRTAGARPRPIEESL